MVRRLFNGAVTWTDATFKSYRGAPCQIEQISAGTCSAATGGQKLSGESVNGAPERQIYVNYQQGFNTRIGYSYFGLDYSWRDSVIFDGDLDPNTEQPGFA